MKKGKEKWMIYIYFSNSFQRVSIVFLSSPPHYQAEYLIFRKWPIDSGES